jgi:hypothetical protein
LITANEQTIEGRNKIRKNEPSTATTLGKSALKIVTSASLSEVLFSILAKILKK